MPGWTVRCVRVYVRTRVCVCEVYLEVPAAQSLQGMQYSADEVHLEVPDAQGLQGMQYSPVKFI